MSELPELAFREALINAVMHRDWELTEPTIVEHVGSAVTVQSPGGFFGGVTADTVLTAASMTRNRRTKFKPGAFTALTGIEASKITDGRVSLKAAFGHDLNHREFDAARGAL